MAAAVADDDSDIRSYSMIAGTRPMEQTTLAVDRVPVQNFLMAVPERLAPVAGPLLLKRFTREGLDSLELRSGRKILR